MVECTNCLHGNIRPFFIFAHFVFVVGGRIFNTWQILMSQVNFLLSQLCLGEFKTWRDRVQVKKGEITRGEMTLYTVSSFLIKLKT